jgi:hypothetical protein
MALVLLLGHLGGDDVQIFEDAPFLRAGRFREEVEQDHIVKLQPLGLIDRQTEGVLQHRWYLRLALLVSHDYHLVASEL